MNEYFVVNVYLCDKFKENKKFTNYNAALDYAKKLSYLGYYSTVLCFCNEKIWRKVKIYPSESF